MSFWDHGIDHIQRLGVKTHLAGGSLHHLGIGNHHKGAQASVAMGISVTCTELRPIDGVLGRVNGKHAGGVQHGWQMEARSKNIYGPYEHKVVLHQGNSIINGPHQGGWIDTENGEDWFIHFQDLNMYGRVTHLQPAKWVNDWLEIGVDTNKDNIGEPVFEIQKA